MENNNNNNNNSSATTEQKTAAVPNWKDLDFSLVPASELGHICNMFNQRLATIERCVYRKNDDGNLMSDPQTGMPVTIADYYQKEAAEKRKQQQQPKQATTTPEDK